MKFTKEPKQDLEAATAKMESTKGKKSSVSSKLTGATTGTGAAGVASNKADDEDKKKLHQRTKKKTYLITTTLKT